MVFVLKIIQSIQVQRHTRCARMKKTIYYSDSPRSTFSEELLEKYYLLSMCLRRFQLMGHSYRDHRLRQLDEYNSLQFSLNKNHNLQGSHVLGDA